MSETAWRGEYLGSEGDMPMGEPDWIESSVADSVWGEDQLRDGRLKVGTPLGTVIREPKELLKRTSVPPRGRRVLGLGLQHPVLLVWRPPSDPKMCM